MFQKRIVAMFLCAVLSISVLLSACGDAVSEMPIDTVSDETNADSAEKSSKETVGIKTNTVTSRTVTPKTPDSKEKASSKDENVTAHKEKDEKAESLTSASDGSEVSSQSESRPEVKKETAEETLPDRTEIEEKPSIKETAAAKKEKKEEGKKGDTVSTKAAEATKPSEKPTQARETTAPETKATAAPTTAAPTKAPETQPAAETTVAATEAHQPTIQDLFDLKNWKNDLTIAGDSGFLCFRAKDGVEINPWDVSFAISGIGAAAYNYCEEIGAQYNGYSFGTHYFISSEQNCVADVIVGYEPNMYLPFRIEIYAENAMASFTVTALYKGEVLASSNVNVTHQRPERLYDIALVGNLITGAGWDDSMTAEQKLEKLAKYINEFYTYNQCTCVTGAYLMMIAARVYLGIPGCYYERNTAKYPTCKVNGISRSTGSAAAAAGHVYLVTNINGKARDWNVQGH